MTLELRHSINNRHSRMRFRTFPTGPNGFRIIEGQELNPENPNHKAQVRFDELVQVAKQFGGSASFIAVDESEKPVPVDDSAAVKPTPTSSENNDVRLKKTTKQEKLRRQQDNMAHFTGFRHGVFYRNGKPSKK